MYVLSCDPGLTGALALICFERGLLEVTDIPTCSNGQESGSMKRWVDVPTLLTILRQWSARHDFASESVHAVIERPIPMPTLPAQTIASQFDTFGALRATLVPRFAKTACFASPREWQKFFGLKADKDRSRATCLSLYPQAPVTLVKHHNRAEAILIGRWYLRSGIEGLPREPVYLPPARATTPTPEAESLPF